MSTVKANTIQPKDAASDLTLGASGDTVTVAADSININKVQDKGGNTLWDYSTGAFVAGNEAFGSQNLKLLSTSTISGGYSISFTSLIDSTYDVYMFKFIQCNPAINSATWSFQMGSNYNTTITTSFFRALHSEDDTVAQVGYDQGNAQQQGTAFQKLAQNVMNDADACVSGELYLFAPLSTTYVKQFYSRSTAMRTGPLVSDVFVGGYFNTTSALSQIQFKFDSGLFDGTIKMYGLL